MNSPNPRQYYPLQYYAATLESQVVDGHEQSRWMVLAELSFEDSSLLQKIVESDDWQNKTSKYRDLIGCLDLSDLEQRVTLTKTQMALLEELLKEKVQVVVPGVGPLTADQMAFAGVETVSELVAFHDEFSSSILPWASFCLHLRRNLELHRNVYFRVALFARMVSRLRLADTK